MKRTLESTSISKKVARRISATDITSFFNASSRSENDASNKVREKILKQLSDIPQYFLADEEHGKFWTIVRNEWNDALKRISNQTVYTSTQIELMGGRNYNYDANLKFFDGETLVTSRKIEFKNGGSNICNLPQFLSLQTKVGLFKTSYDEFYYENYLDKYIACDIEIIEPKPSLETYLSNVGSTKYEVLPFFEHLKNRGSFFKKDKNKVVNASITSYLSKYGRDVNIQFFTEKIKSSQGEKTFIIWSKDRTFHIDAFAESEMTNMTFDGIKNGNVLQIKSGNTTYELLLRWRNHKGILNPAWQISMKRK